MNKKISILKNLFANHTGKVSDKWSNYIAEYDRLFLAYRNRPIQLLEIGTQNGGSLEIWSTFFVNAKKLVGCDINPDCAQLRFDNPNVVVVVANANTDEAQQNILAHSPSFDIIIDDGSHHSGDVVSAFARYFTHLNIGGLYVIEDLHCSYWHEFGGGLFDPYSSMAFFKRFADLINHEHWGIDKTRNEFLNDFNRKYNIKLDESMLTHVHSIEFINSMCVIKKAPPADNVLGSRVISGTIALVDKGPIPFHGLGGSPSNQNQWSARDESVEDELMARLQEVASLNIGINERDREITRLNRIAAEREKIYAQQLQETRQASWQHQVNREREFAQQIIQVMEINQQVNNGQFQLHSETERVLIEQLQRMHLQMELVYRNLIQHERSLQTLVPVKND